MADKELYRACAVEVKRQIWQDNQALFGDEVSPLLKQYILEKESALFSTELSVLHNFFSPSPKARRQGEVRRGHPDHPSSPLCIFHRVLLLRWVGLAAGLARELWDVSLWWWVSGWCTWC